MIRFLKFFAIALLLLIMVPIIIFWTPEGDRDELIETYTNEASAFAIDGDGMKIHYRDEGNKDGAPIILLHGSNASLHTWADMVSILSDDYRLISLDFPGHGLTGPDPKQDYSAASLIDAAKTVMDETGVERAVIAGNSMGGWAAWRFALEYPERVSGLVLIDASGPVIEEEADPYLAAKITNSVPGQLLALRVTPRPIIRQTLSQVMYDDAQITDELVERYRDMARFPGNRKAMSDRAKVDREAGYWDRVGEIGVPVLILWGEHDVTTPVAFAHAFDAAINDTKLVIYPNAAHLPMEEIPADVARDIRTWMTVKLSPDGAEESANIQ